MLKCQTLSDLVHPLFDRVEFVHALPGREDRICIQKRQRPQMPRGVTNPSLLLARRASYPTDRIQFSVDFFIGPPQMQELQFGGEGTDPN